ncbi:MAG: adenosine kinase, partial [Desulfobacteraceae bacterium]
ENDYFLEKIQKPKGGMIYVEKDFIESTLEILSDAPSIVPGGSACNTVVGVGRLGGNARFVGKCGNDKFGKLFQSDLQKQNVEPALFYSDSHTGRVLSIITPDAQRSMLTYLGASAEVSPEEITSQAFQNAGIIHVEGYLISNQLLISEVLKKAKESGAIVSLDLASYNVVEESKEQLEELVDNFVDILIANEDEAYAFTGIKDEIKSIEALAEKAKFAVMKIGARGSYIHYKDQLIKSDGFKIETVVDTTGAGDLWASGFLYGLVTGYSLEKCGKLGNACGAEVCQVVGANIPDQGWDRIRKLLEE